MVSNQNISMIPAKESVTDISMINNLRQLDRKKPVDNFLKLQPVIGDQDEPLNVVAKQQSAFEITLGESNNNRVVIGKRVRDSGYLRQATSEDEIKGKGKIGHQSINNKTGLFQKKTVDKDKTIEEQDFNRIISLKKQNTDNRKS